MSVMKIFLSLALLTYVQPIKPSAPEIVSISSNFPVIENWVEIPKGTKNITFNVQANNTETVLFWLIPTGTENWNQRKLIGYDLKTDEQDNSFTLTWNINKSYLHDHLYVQAIGEGIENGTLNLQME
ncbi:hypothetical protein [Neobacillus sp. YIM B06451]|uniref:hypothetical protein n=1 Tax=Neobacillus sp. YIM B06451 TaxID=3070994 RepID=UPI00292FF5A4|nr:hypothetical protein [Neobacillus sp. YIM B06451]